MTANPTSSPILKRVGEDTLQGDGYAEVARLREALTPSAATKAAYIGEFKFQVEEIDEDGEGHSVTFYVPWTTTKKIMAAIRERASGSDSVRIPSGDEK